jgi:hypothetical protein
MHLEKRVIVVTPAGRKENMELLVRYMLRDRGLVDEYHLWLNTTNDKDLEYLHSLERSYPEYISCKERDPEIHLDMTKLGFSIYQFFRYCTRPDTVYVRLDDDICYVHHDAIRELVDFRIRNPQYFLVYGNTINNALCSCLHQKMALIDSSRGIAGYNCTDSTGWRDPRFAEHVHRTFFRHRLEGNLDKYKFAVWELNSGERNSINCISWLGEEFEKFNGEVGVDEEEWLARSKPIQLGKINSICGSAIVCHYAFFTQRPHLEKTDILETYKAICHQDTKE